MDRNILSKARCTEEEKKELLKVVFLMTNLADKCREQGLVYLQNIRNTTGNKFLEIAIKLIIDGFEADFICEVLENIIIVEECDSKSLLEKILILEAAIKIHNGFSGEVVKSILLSLLGEKWMTAYIDKELSEFSSKSDISEEERQMQELIFEKNEESVKEDHIYFNFLEAIKNTLKSYNFLSSLAALYWMGEVKEQDSLKINKATEEVLNAIDEHFTSTLIEAQENFQFYCQARRGVFDRLLNIMNNRGYINFNATAEFALERFINLKRNESNFNESKIAGMKYEFPRRINEFLKLVIIIIAENAKIYDFNIINKAVLRTIVDGKEAETLRNEFKRIL